MGLTYDQAKALGLERFHPAATGGQSRERELLDKLEAGRPARTAFIEDGMTKLERRFRDDVLMPALGSRHITGYWREPLKLRIGGRTYYTPDFLVSEWAGDHGLPPRLTFVETKGYMREDACVKLKVAAGMFDVFRWLLVSRPMKAWEVRPITGAGIGRDPIRVAWI